MNIAIAALYFLESIFMPGIMNKRSGVMVGDIVPACPIALEMFDPIQNRKELKNLMNIIDTINQQYGTKTIKLGVEGKEKQP